MTEDELTHLRAWLWGLVARATDWNGEKATVRMVGFLVWCATLIFILFGWIICLIGSGQTDLHRMQWFHTGEWVLVSWPTLVICGGCLVTLNRGVVRARGKHRLLSTAQRERLFKELEPMLDEHSTDIIQRQPGSYDYD